MTKLSTTVVEIEKDCQGPFGSLFYMPFTEAEIVWRSSKDENSFCSAEK